MISMITMVATNTGGKPMTRTERDTGTHKLNTMGKEAINKVGHTQGRG